MSLPTPEPVLPDEPQADEPQADDPQTDDEGESVELQDRDVDDAGHARFDCTTGDADRTAAAVDAARRAVEDGDCIVLPTDTVYGIGADAFSASAVQALLDAKNRGRDMPPPVLIGDASLVRALATDVPDEARALVEAHWPGPLTIVCRIQPSLRMDLGDTDGTIALRVPDHDLARDILRRTGPLAVSSANLSGHPAALTCDEAVDQLRDRVAVYLDGGPLGSEQDGSRTSLPSTIVDFTRHDEGRLLRRGALGLETLRRTVPGLRDLEDAAPEAPAGPSEPGAVVPGAADPSPADPGAARSGTADPGAADLVQAEDPVAPDPSARNGSTAMAPGPGEQPAVDQPAAAAQPPQPDEPRVEPEPER